MLQPLLIIVTGHPCTGKTTLAQRLAADLGLPLVSRDDIKERLFDSLGWSDRAWSQRLGRASYTLLYYTVDVLLTAGQSLIAESNFDPGHARPEFLGLKERYGCHTFVIHCRTEPDTLIRRFQARDASGERHPGHIYPPVYEDLKRRLVEQGDSVLDLGGPTLALDTTDFTALDYTALYDALKSELSTCHGLPDRLMA